MDMCVHLLVDRSIMIREEELKQIEGGSLTAAFLTAISRGINSIADLGRSLGSSIRRIQTGRFCR